MNKINGIDTSAIMRDMARKNATVSIGFQSGAYREYLIIAISPLPEAESLIFAEGVN